jgi:hypothetical protein
MTVRSARVIPGVGGVLIRPGLRLSFQRFPLPGSGMIDEAPASLGALPVCRAADGSLLLPLADGEAFWIGLSTDPPGMEAEVSVSALLSDGTAVEEGPIPVAPIARLAGMRRADGRYGAFARAATAAHPGCVSLAFRCRFRRGAGRRGARAAELTLLLVDGQTFAAAAGRAPPPLDPAAGYGGWRLP